jgi:hypothetical protein
VEEIGRTRPTIVAELMEEANKFADGDDTAAGITKEDEIR